MRALIQSGVKWLRSCGDITHHNMVVGLTAVSLPIIQTLPPSGLATVALTTVGTQLGTQVWVANVAGPVMFLNMSKPQFGDIQARLFPKFGMVGMSTGIMALAAYSIAHPTPDLMTYLLAASTGSHFLQSYVVVPITTKYQYQLRALKDGSQEKKVAGMKFGISHSISVLLAYAAMGINIYFFYSVGSAIGVNW